MIACGPNFHPALLVLGAAALGTGGLFVVVWLGGLVVDSWRRTHGDPRAAAPARRLPWQAARRGLAWLALLNTAATVIGVLLS